MSSIAVVTCGTADMSFAIGTMLLNFKSKTKIKNYDTFIFSDSKIRQKDKSLFEQKLNCKIIDYICPVDLSETKNRFIKYFSPIVFSKFETLKLLKSYDQVLYLDYDIVILENIDDLFLKKDGFAFLEGDRLIKDTLSENIYEYKTDTECVAAGTFILNSKGLKESNINEMYEFCIFALKEYEDKLMLPEQNVFDLMIQKFSLNVGKLNKDIFALHPSEYNKDFKTKILHCYGKKKFWNNYYFQYWESDYRVWKKIGGSSFKPFKYFIKTLTRKLTK